MKKILIKYINFFFGAFGYKLISYKKLQQQKRYSQFLEDLQLTKPYPVPKEYSLNNLHNHDVNIIVFSKDRVIQLHALLSSFYTNVAQPVTVQVLYFASTQEHELAYKQVQQLFREQNIIFVKEKKFKEDLIQLVNNLTVSRLLFLVDDILFVEPFDLKEITKYPTEKFVPSLRMGKHLNFSYTVQLPQPLPPFLPNILPDESDKIVWNWADGKLDWNYPLSVDGHLFSVQEIKLMLPLLDFKAPNSLEEAMQLFKPFYLRKLGVAYQKAKIINIPCNKVQEENDNIAEEVTPEYLLGQWQRGYQIDYSKLFKFINTSAHQYIPFHYVKRKE